MIVFLIKNKERLSLVEQIFDITKFPNLDIDLLASDYKNDKTLMIQLRSRDDTGGTTAKGSLVELLQELLRLNKVPQSNILYLVCIWDARDTQQKVSTVRKMYSKLKDFTQVNEADFHYDINSKVELNKNISLKIAYGTDDEIVQRIIPLWQEDSIPMKTLSDKAQYIRDLLFLKAHYERNQLNRTNNTFFRTEYT